MNIKLIPGQDVTETFKRSITILNNLRRFQKKWEENYGVELKTRKKTWEEKADKFLESLGATDELGKTEKINIEHKTNQT